MSQNILSNQKSLAARQDEKKIKTITVTSSAFTHESQIPVQYTCDGKDVSPPLAWEGIPEGAKGIGTHRYYFKVYALDTKLDLKDGALKQDLVRAMQGHILGQGELMGRYKRMGT